MKTKEQIIEWLKGQKWFKEFCLNAGFRGERELIEYVEIMMYRPEYIILGAFVWPEMERDYWSNCECDYLKWLNSDDEKQEEATEKNESKADDRFIFDRGSREAPFYMVLIDDDSSSGIVKFCFPTFELALGKAHEVCKIRSRKAYVFAAVSEIHPEVVTKEVSINDMEGKLSVL